MMFRIYLLILVPLIWLSNLNAQTEISGSIFNDSGEPIPGANLYIQGTFEGTSSDLEGNFVFETQIEDSIILIASFIGFEEVHTDLVLRGAPIFTNIVLSESANYLGEIVISAGVFEAGNNKSEVLKPLDIVTTAGVTADVPGALNTLPGTQTVGEEGRLFVRGGDSYETTTFIDGMLVLESYDQRAPNVPTRSRFSPFMFSGTSFSTGGYSAEYGQGLSSALILNTRDVATMTRTDLSLMSVGLEAAHSQVGANSSFSGKIGYVNLDPYFEVIRQEFDWIDPPTSFDGNLAFRKNVGTDGLFKVYGKMNLSGMKFRDDQFESGNDPVAIDMTNNYGHLNASYKDFLSGRWVLRTGISYTKSNEDIIPGLDKIQQRTTGLHVKTVSEYQHNTKWFWRFGGELIKTDHFEDFDDFETDFANRFEFSQTLLSNFVESEIYLTTSVLARFGIRSEYNSLNEELSFDPRISIAYKTGANSQFSGAFGIFRQSAPNNLLRISNLLQPEKALHYIVNYQYMKDNRTFRMEAYLKDYSNLVAFDSQSIFDPASYSNRGSGHASGIDVFYRDAASIENADFWFSYSFLDTERFYRDYPMGARPGFSSRHNLSFVYKHFIPGLKSQLGLTYTYGSSRPYNDPNEEAFNNGNTPAYHDLSVNISYLPKPNLIVYMSVTNVLRRDNIFGYEFREVKNLNGIYEGRPLMLPAPRFLFLGFFITLSKEGTVNQLPQL